MIVAACLLWGSGVLVGIVIGATGAVVVVVKRLGIR